MFSDSPAPVFDGKAENFASYQQEVDLWLMVTNLPVSRRAPALALAMDKLQKTGLWRPPIFEGGNKGKREISK